MSNMRSTRDASQLPLWEDDPVRVLPPERRAGRAPQLDGAVVVDGREFASRGWGPGTVLLTQPVRRAARGEMVVVRDGDRVLVGVLGLDVGRRALFTDHGATWLAEGARVTGVVVAAEPPLAF